MSIPGTPDTPPPKILLVEGPSDERIVRYIRKRCADLPEFKIRPCNGWPGLKEEIRQQFVVESRIALGIMVDANDDVIERWNEVNRELRECSGGIDLPARPEYGGTILEIQPRVGIWLMPDNQSRGEIEDFVAAMIPVSDPVWPLSKGCIGSIPQDHRRFSERKTVRAQVYAWTATLKNPGGLLSAASRETRLNVDSESTRMFVNWIRKLFHSGDP